MVRGANNYKVISTVLGEMWVIVGHITGGAPTLFRSLRIRKFIVPCVGPMEVSASLIYPTDNYGMCCVPGAVFDARNQEINIMDVILPLEEL